MISLNDNPRVTALFLTYNNATSVAKSLETLLAQDHANFNILISDDASSDDTVAICEHYAIREPRIRIVRHQKNRGQFGNLLFAALEADGDFAFWACPGDFWDPRFVSVCLAALKKIPNAVAALPSTTFFREQTREHWTTQRFDQYPPPETIPYWKLAAMVPVKTRPNDHRRRRFGLYLHGLVHRPTLCAAVEAAVALGNVASERIVVYQIALAGRFVTTSEILFHKETSDRPYILRAPHDPTSWIRHDPRWYLAKMAWQLSVSMVRTRAVPLHRKFYLPVIVGYYVIWNLLDRARIRLVGLLRAVLPTAIYNWLRTLGGDERIGAKRTGLV